MSDFDFMGMGLRISNRRFELGFTQQEVYEKLDISANHYSRIENGHVGMSFKVLVELCGILNVSADYILTGNDGAKANTESFSFAEKFSELSNKQRQYIIKQMDLLKEMNLK